MEIAGEQEEALVALVVVTSIDGDRVHLATEAGIDTVNPHLVANSILTSHLAPTEVAAQLDHLLVLDPPPAPLPVLPLVDTVMTDVIGLQSAAAELTVDPPPPNPETTEKGDAIRTTVIDTDPIPAVIHHAHEVPEETNGDAAQSPAA